MFDKPVLRSIFDILGVNDKIPCRRKELIEVVGDLAARGIELRSLKESIDTSTPAISYRE